MMLSVLLSLVQGFSSHTLPVHDVSAEVHREAKQTLHIHDVFKEYQQGDEKEEKYIKADKNMMSLLQTKLWVNPVDKLANEVRRESNQNLQIHDEFQSREREDKNEEKRVRTDHNLAALLQKKNDPADKLAAEVRRESNQNLQIHDHFSEREKEDKTEERRVKADHNLSALQKKTNPAERIAAEVRQETSQNLQIHEQFQANEKEDKTKEKEIKKDHNLSALQRKSSPEDKVAAEVRQESSQNLHVNEGFKALENEDDKHEKEIKSDKNLSELQWDSNGDSHDDNNAMDAYLGVTGFHIPTASVKETSTETTETIRSSDSIADGMVTTVPLSSQLQESASFLQKSMTSLRGKRKAAPNVETSVKREMMEDVYLQDAFRSLEKKDDATVRKVKKNPYMKA